MALPAVAQDVIFPLEKPYAAPMRHIVILKGNLAPKGAVLKFSVSVVVVRDGADTHARPAQFPQAAGCFEG